MEMNNYQLQEVLTKHKKWLLGEDGGERAVLIDADLRGAVLTGADLRGAYLTRAVLTEADLTRAVLRGAYLTRAYLTRAVLTEADLRGAVLTEADLTRAVLRGADLTRAVLRGAVLRGAYLTRAVLSEAVLRGAYLTRAVLSEAVLSEAVLRGAVLSEAVLRGADLTRAVLRGAVLRGADLRWVKGLVKLMGVEPGNFYWKRFDAGLNNNGYQFFVGLNTLNDEEEFAADDRMLCSYPGFHFASRSWCAVNYSDRPLEARIRIPEDAQVNEPWATDGKASADKIEILQVFDTATGEDVTDQYRRPTP